MKKKIKTLGLLLAVLILCLTLLTACSADLDKNGVSDIAESNGTYIINAPGQEAFRQEKVVVKNTQSNLSANISGAIYTSLYNKTFTFTDQKVTIKQMQGNIWYVRVKCNDGVERVIFVTRSGIGDYVASGGIDLTLGEVGVGFTHTYTVYNEYGKVLYLSYEQYNYLK